MDRIADYTFIRSLGKGNHGDFYLATPPPRLGIDAEYVAVKVLASTTTDDAFGERPRSSGCSPLFARNSWSHCSTPDRTATASITPGISAELRRRTV